MGTRELRRARSFLARCRAPCLLAPDSHGLWADSCFDARGFVGSVYSTSMFNLSTGGDVLQDVPADGFKDMYITVCNGACTADAATGVITNRRGSPARILSSSAKNDGLAGVNVTLETQVLLVALWRGVVRYLSRDRAAAATSCTGQPPPPSPPSVSLSRALCRTVSRSRCYCY